MVTSLVVDYTQVDVSEELSCNISHLLMSRMIIDGITVELGLSFTNLHIVDTNAIIRKGFSMNITDSLTNLKELFV